MNLRGKRWNLKTSNHQLLGQFFTNCENELQRTVAAKPILASTDLSWKCMVAIILAQQTKQQSLTRLSNTSNSNGLARQIKLETRSFGEISIHAFRTSLIHKSYVESRLFVFFVDHGIGTKLFPPEMVTMTNLCRDHERPQGKYFSPNMIYFTFKDQSRFEPWTTY